MRGSIKKQRNGNKRKWGLVRVRMRRGGSGKRPSVVVSNEGGWQRPGKG